MQVLQAGDSPACFSVSVTSVVTSNSILFLALRLTLPLKGNQFNYPSKHPHEYY